MKFKKVLASVFASLFAITSVVTLASCKKDDDPTPDQGDTGTDDTAPTEAEIVQAALDALKVDAAVNSDFTLVTKGNGNVVISWASSNADVISISGGNATVTRGLSEDVTVKLTATAVLNNTTLTKEFTVLVYAAEDITSSVTIKNGYVTIPYNAFTGDGTYDIVVGDGKKVTILCSGHVDKSNYKEFGLAKGTDTTKSFIKIKTTGVKLDGIISDVFGPYNNMKCYVGTDATGTLVSPAVGPGQGRAYTYLFENDAESVYFVNDSKYEVAFYGLQLILENSYVEPTPVNENITTKVTNTDGVISIPYGAIDNNGKFTIDVAEGKSIVIEWTGYAAVPNLKEFGLTSQSVIKVTTTGGLKLDAFVTDVYGTYDEMKCYIGTDNTGTLVPSTEIEAKSKSVERAYGFASAVESLYLVNNSSKYEVQFYGIEIYTEGTISKLVEKLVENEVNKLADKVSDSTYEAITKIDFSSVYGEVTVTPQAGATTLSVTGNVLTITPKSNEVTETISIKLTNGLIEKVVENISIKSKKYTPALGSANVTAQYTGETTKMVLGENNAELLGVKPALFNITTNAAGSYNNKIGLNKDGSIRLYAASGNGNELTISAQSFDTVKIKIDKITLTYGTTLGAFTVNGTTGSKETAEYVINGSKVVIKNTDASSQVHLKSIKIDYTVSQLTDLDRAQAEAEKLAALIGASYTEDAEIDLTPASGYTLTINPQAAATALIPDGNTLKIDVGTEVVTETLTLTVTYNDQSYTTPNISVEVIGVIPTIQQVIEGTLGSHITKGTVVAVTTKSFVIKDATGCILVYLNKTPDPEVALGDVVKVTGTTSKFNDVLVQFGSKITYEIVGTETVVHPTVTDLDAAALDALLTADPMKVQYVSFTGVLSVSGNYYNINVPGTTKAVGSIKDPITSAKTALSGLDGKKIKVTGYFVGVSGTKYVNIAYLDHQVIPFTDAEKAEIEANRLAAKISESYSAAETPIDFTPSAAEYTVSITKVSETVENTISLTANTLTIRATATPATAEFTITVEYNGESYTTPKITITCNASVLKATSSFTYSSDSTEKYLYANNTDYASRLFSSADAELFEAKINANSCTQKNTISGVATDTPACLTSSNNGLQLYGGTGKAGTSLVITAKEKPGYTIVIKSVTIVAKANSIIKVGSESVTINAGNSKEFVLGENASSVEIHNNNTSQAKIASIVISYELVPNAA